MLAVALGALVFVVLPLVFARSSRQSLEHYVRDAVDKSERTLSHNDLRVRINRERIYGKGWKN